MIGSPAIAGRFFYADDSCSSFNFHRQQVGLGPLLAELTRLAEEAAPAAIYANSATAVDHLPGWEAAHPLALPVEAPARLWIGNAVRVATHFDTSHNLAVVVGGHRRFTVFPPDQFANLYVGPLDVTPAGQPISLVDPDAPDLDRFPRFAAAAAVGRTAELAPGDALYLPPLWWHHVRSLSAINVLANYWWGHQSGDAFTALIHAVLAVRDLPEGEKAVWRGWFDDLVFAPSAAAAADHLPAAARSALGPPGEARRRHITGFLIRMLQRG
ncbi:MAG: cupin-like domain-containing protein [Sphingomonas sp.]